MHWILLALIPALSVAIRDVSIKTYEDLPPLKVAGIELFWSLPVLIIGTAIITIPPLDSIFWWNFFWSIPLNIVGYLLYLYAIKYSPVSLSVPFLSFTPVFMMVTGMLVLGESVNAYGGVGVVSIVFGSYVLHMGDGKAGLLEPFRSFTREKGAWLMLIVAFVFAMAAVVGKKAMMHSSPLFFSYFFFLTFNLIILAGLILFKQCSLLEMTKDVKRGGWLAMLLVLHVSFHALAIVSAKAVYMVAVKRCSILFTVILSWYILNEGHRVSRGIGALFMVVGVFLLSIAG